MGKERWAKIVISHSTAPTDWCALSLLTDPIHARLNWVL